MVFLILRIQHLLVSVEVKNCSRALCLSCHTFSLMPLDIIIPTVVVLLITCVNDEV